MARRGGAWWHRVLMFTGVLWFAVGLAVVGAFLLTKELPTAAHMAELFGLPVVVVTAVESLLAWGRRPRAAAAPTTASVARAKDVLAGLVAQQWRTEALLRSLDDPDPIPVQWRLTRDEQVMNHHANLAASPPLSGASDQIQALVSEFRRMRRRRLVVLGGPGTGKTTLAVQLLLALLSPRHEDEPVPVLLSVAGWDTTAFPRLHEWLGVRLEQDYPALRAAELGPDMAQTLAERGHILPILDGLDELPPAAQAKGITALNRSLGSEDQLILTSRTTEFGHAVRSAGEVLHSAVVVEPDPLDPATAADYLSRCRPRQPGPVWEQILTGLRKSPAPPPGPLAALAQISATPLGLWLLRAVYITSRTDPTPLIDPGRFPDLSALRAHLFDQLIEALIITREPSTDPADLFRPRRRYDPTRVRRWLGCLAHHLSCTTNDDATTGTRDFAWWHLARDTLTRRRWLTLGLTLGLTYGLAVWLISVLSGAESGGFGGAAKWDGLTAGLIVGLAIGLRGTSWSQEFPGFADLRIRGRLRQLANLRGAVLRTILAAGLAVGLMAGLVAGLTSRPEAGLMHGLMYGLKFVFGFGFVFGLMGGLTYGFLKWAETPTRTAEASAPMTSWRDDRTLNMLRIAAFGITIALTLGLTNGIAYGRMTGPMAGLTSGLAGMLVGVLVFGLPIGLWPGRYHAWLAYLVATYQLARTDRLPRRLMPFLDDARRLGLLHAVGPVYQFRHAELQDHLAATYRP
ncbi:MAG: NACHT domain-containing protein [Actinoallomurus sp.]